MITEDYVSFEVAKLLKEKGFDVPCRVFYKDPQAGLYEFKNAPKAYKDKIIEPCFLAPSLYMAMKWLREKGIHISPKYCCFQGSKRNDEPYYKWEDRVLRLSTNNQVHPQLMGIHEYYNTYEEAVEAALKYSLENLI